MPLFMFLVIITYGCLIFVACSSSLNKVEQPSSTDQNLATSASTPITQPSPTETAPQTPLNLTTLPMSPTLCISSPTLAAPPTETKDEVLTTPTSTVVTPSLSISELIEAQAVILYTQWVSGTFPLLSWPELDSLDGEEFRHIYGNQIGYLYTDNFAPRLSSSATYLAVPGNKWEPETLMGPENMTTWVVNLATGNVTELEDMPPYAIWSPTENQLAYAQAGTVFVENMDTDEKAPVFEAPDTPGFFMSWSPEGQQIAVISLGQLEEPINGTYPPIIDSLWLVSVNSEEPKQLGTFSIEATEYDFREIQWSPDGSALFVAMTRPNYVFTATGQQITLEDVSRTLAWLPHQPDRLLVRKSDGNMYIINSQTQEVYVQITENSPSIVDYAFSNDSHYLAYSSNSSVSVYDLEKEMISSIATFPAEIVSTLRWLPSNDVLIIDDGDWNTPIWGVTVPESKVEVLIEKGLLINVIQASVHN